MRTLCIFSTVMLLGMIPGWTQNRSVKSGGSNNPFRSIDLVPSGRYQPETFIKNDSSLLKGTNLYIRYNFVDATDEITRYANWQQWTMSNMKEAYFGGTLRVRESIYSIGHVADYVRAYFEDSPQDNQAVPPPDLFVTIELTELAITTGKKVGLHPLHFYHFDQQRNLYLGSYQYDQEFKTCTMKATLIARDAVTCRVHYKKSETVEVTIDAGQARNFGDLEAIPTSYRNNSFPVQKPTDKKVIIKTQLRLMARLFYRFHASFLKRVVKKRHAMQTLNTSH